MKLKTLGVCNTYAFLWQEWLGERPSILIYTYIACHFKVSFKLPEFRFLSLLQHFLNTGIIIGTIFNV